MSGASPGADARALAAILFRQPRTGMRHMLCLGLDARSVWLLFGVIVILNAIADYVMLSLLSGYAPALEIRLEVPSPFSIAATKAMLLPVVAWVLGQLGLDAPVRAERFHDILLALILYRAMATLFMTAAIAVFLVNPVLASYLLAIAQLYLVWLVAGFAAVALGDIPTGNALLLLFLALLIGMGLFLLAMVMIVSVFGLGG